MTVCLGLHRGKICIQTYATTGNRNTPFPLHSFVHNEVVDRLPFSERAMNTLYKIITTHSLPAIVFILQRYAWLVCVPEHGARPPYASNLKEFNSNRKHNLKFKIPVIHCLYILHFTRRRHAPTHNARNQQNWNTKTRKTHSGAQTAMRLPVGDCSKAKYHFFVATVRPCNLPISGPQIKWIFLFVQLKL